MIVDGQGEWGSITYFAYRDGAFRQIQRVKGEESLGILYSICTILCGFDPDKGEEWKVMGLAPYGKLDPEIYDAFKDLVKIDGLTIRYPSLRHVQEWFCRLRPKARPPAPRRWWSPIWPTPRNFFMPSR
jgi:carbamoyltransferase